MKLGIMQPYFFPYIGYYELIWRTDKWVVFDIVQYNARSWMNRNRILHPNEGWQYIGVPVKKNSRASYIKDIEICDKYVALNRILGQLGHYKRYAPFFYSVINIVETVFEATKSSSLVDINVASLSVVCEYLDINFDWSICSEMNLTLENIEHPGQWALSISRQMGASEYINPPSGKDIFKPDEWVDAKIDLNFMVMPCFNYDCSPYHYTENLSILDVLMWNSPESIVKRWMHG